MRDWIAFHVAIVVLLGLEWLMAHRVRDPFRRALWATIIWVTAALALAIFVWHRFSAPDATAYLAGYALEEALSVDNLFVFLLLFRLFQIPEGKQQKVLFWGVTGAIVLRGLFIAGGIQLLARFAWIDYIFGAIILVAAIRLLKPEDPAQAQQLPAWIRWLTRVSPVSPSQESFLAREDGRLLPTVLLLALIAVELTDVVFALDSIPAVLSITRTPFLAYTSNIMAVMGLRSLYVLLASTLSRLRFLHYGLAATLAFAAVKILGEHWFTVGPLASLGVIVVLLGITVTASLLHPAPKTRSA